YREKSHCKYFLGSNASRTASPIKMSKDNNSAKATKPLMPNHGACKLAFPWPSNSPREAEPGGKPKPIKSKVVSVVMAPFKINGIKVRVATIAFGNICRNIMV